MEDTTKLMLVGVGGYLLWQYFNPAVAVAAAAPASMPASSSPVTTAPATTAPASAAVMTGAQQTLAVLQQMGPEPVLLAAQNSGQLPVSGQLNPSQWNWFMSTVSGIPSPGIANYVGLSNAGLTINQYWAALMQWASDQVTGNAPPPLSAMATTDPAGAQIGVIAMAGLAGLGQPGRSTQNKFAAPGTNETGRYDLTEMAW